MARVAGPFGIKGWLKLQTFTEYADSLEQFKTWFLATPKGWREIEVEDFAVNNKAVVAKLKGVDDRTAAELLGKPDIAVPREWLDQESADEYYWIDLIGSDVVNQLGENLGKVETLLETGANDVLVVKSDVTQTLIPFIQPYLLRVDRQQKIITVDWDKRWNDSQQDE